MDTHAPRSNPGGGVQPAAGPGTPARVLVVEDELDIAGLIKHALERSGDGRVQIVATGDAALRAVTEQVPDLMILDLNLPGLSGIEVCRILRGRPATAAMPIIMLTARSGENDRVAGLDLGADDYVTKPFELPELVARVRAALRRSGADEGDSRVVLGDLEIDPVAFRASKGGTELDLTATEFRLLLELARRPGQVFTRELLLERVWNYTYLGDSRLVDVAVQRLRAKIEDDPRHPALIATVRGVGYRLDRP
jgi:two-component system response regulator MtrA